MRFEWNFRTSNFQANFSDQPNFSEYHIKFGREKKPNNDDWEHQRKTAIHIRTDDTGPNYHIQVPRGMINDKTNLKDQIVQLERKLEAAYKTILAIAGDRHFRNTQMETIWKLVTTCLIPIVTYGGETRKSTNTKKKKLDQMLDSIIKRILMVPTSTPREALCIETGLLDVETLDDKNRISMGERLGKNPSNNLLGEITNQDTPRGWKEYLEETKIKYDTENTNEDEANNTSPNEKILKACKTRIEKGGENKSKINYLLEGHQGWILGQPKSYMLQLGRIQASTIFKARTRMLHVKNN